MNEREAKIAILQRLLWDYNILPEDCLDVLEGKKELAGHYKEERLFQKLLESFPWYTIMELIPLPRIKALLTESLIHSLRTNQLIKRYEFISIRLSETI